MTAPQNPMAFSQPRLSALKVKRINPLALVVLGLIAVPVVVVFGSLLLPSPESIRAAGVAVFEVPPVSKPPQVAGGAALPQFPVPPATIAPDANGAPEPAPRVVELVPAAAEFKPGPAASAPASQDRGAQSQRRREAFLKAVSSSMRPTGDSSGTPLAVAAAPAPTEDPYTAAIAQVLGQRSPAAAGAGADSQLIANGAATQPAAAFSRGLAERGGPDPDEHVLLAVREAARSPYTLSEGTVVPCVLEAGINSDLPGVLRARVSRAVFDSATGRYLLLPQGTLVSGQYDSAVAFGQSRLLVKAERLIFPDSSSLDLQGMPVADPVGMAGFTGKVNRRLLSTFGSALLLGAISGGTQVSQGGFDNTRGESPRQILAAAASQNVSEVSSEMVRRQLAVQPTIEVQPGYQFNLVVSKDIVFGGPWRPAYYDINDENPIRRTRN